MLDKTTIRNIATVKFQSQPSISCRIIR